jgi:ubiquinol-cytochrome c reductase cytochrome b subunit
MPVFTNPTKNQMTPINLVVAVILGVGLLYMSLLQFDVHIPVIVRITGFYLGLLTILTPWLTNKDSYTEEPTRTQSKGLPGYIVWAGVVLFAVLAVVPIKAVAASGGACGSIPCDHMEPDLHDKESLQRGAKWFVNYCMGCHEAKFSRWERVADDLGIPHEEMIGNLVLGDDRIGDLMTIAMPKAEAKAWFGATPPDLTMVARSRNPDWLYTYLRNFYKDDTRPTGVNNKVFDKVAMPHVLMELQGLAECAPGPARDDHGHVIRNQLGEAISDEECGSLKVGSVSGAMDTEEFDQAMYDLVNFMEYIAEPYALDRQKIGVYVLLFISVLFILVWLLNREYWREIH